MKKRYESILFLMMLFGMFLITVSWADFTVSYQILPYSELPPGSNGMVQLTFVNTGTNTISLSLYAQSSSRIESEQSISIGRLKPGASTIITVPFHIDENLSSGVYTFYIHISGEELLSENQKDEERYISRWVNVPIIVKRPVSLSVKIEPNVLETGSDTDVNLTIINNGEKINDVSLIINGSNVKFNGLSNYYLGELTTTKKITVPLSISEEASPGRQEFPLYLKYVNSLGESEILRINVPVLIKKRTPNFLIIMNYSTLLPNTQNTLYLTIKNNGEHIAKDVTLSFSDDHVLIPLSESDIDIGTLLPGEIKSVRVTVATKDVDLGYYKIPVTISYKDENNKEMEPEMSSIGVYISSPPVVDVYITTSPLPVMSGQTHTFSVQATNSGISDVKALKVKVFSNDVFKVLDPESVQYIGALDADDFSTVQYKIKVENVPPGQYPLKFTVSYLDMANVPHTVEITKMINVYSQETSVESMIMNNILSICVIGILIGIIGIAAYFMFKKKGEK